MSGGIMDRVYIGLDNAPAAFDIKGRILGPNGTNLEYIRSETGVVAVLKSDKFEPLHLALHHTRSESIAAAKSLAQNLIETIRAELVQWSAAQAGGPPTPLNVPPPTLTSTTAAPPPVPPPVVSVAMSTPSSMSTTPNPAIIPPVVSVASGPTPLMTVRQPTVLQFLPQQQYVLNQENGQLIPIVQPGVQVPNSNFTSLPIAQQLGIQQPNFGGAQIVDISNMQPVNVTQLRLGGAPSTMSMILPNGLTIPQASLSNADTTTVSSAISAPVVCAAQNTNSCQKIFYSTDKGDKEIKYHIQGAEGMQWTMPGSQTMLIPYQQLQDLAGNQAGLANLQPQQFVSIAPAGGLQQTSLPLSAAQLQQLQAGTIMQLNQKPIASSTSLINIISTGQASSPQILSAAPTPTKNMSQESRGQKRLSDGSPSPLQLRPIAPAGSQTQDKNTSRDRSWNSTTARDNTVVSMGMKINPPHGTIIHVSSGQQTNVSTSGVTQDGTGMYIRQIDRNSIQLQTSKDGQKQDLTVNKIQGATQNVQMITVPQGMTVLQNPLNISQLPTMIGQPNSQVYMIPANQSNLVQGGLPPGLLGQQVLQAGQNVTVMQPNQLGMPNGVQYNMPIMSMAPNSQYLPAGFNLNNLNTQLSAQQINAALAGQQLTNPNLTVSGSIPIIQAPPPSSPMANQAQTLPVSQPPPQVLAQGQTFVTPTSQYTGVPSQYMIQANSGAITIPTNNPTVQYSIPSQTSNGTVNNATVQTNTTEADTNNGNNQNYITSSQENSYAISGATNQNPTQQTFQSETSQASPGYTQNGQNGSHQTYATNTVNTQNPPPYNANQTPTTQPSYNTNTPSQTQTANQNFTNTPVSNTSPPSFSPSTTPVPNQNYPPPNVPPSMPNLTYPPTQTPPNGPNPYPNATGQNMAAYANNQYQYTSRPWFRPRYGSPQGSPYGPGQIPPNGPPMPVPPPTGNYNYWQDS